MTKLWKKIVINFILIASIILSIFIIKFTNSCGCLNNILLHGVGIDATQQTGKWVVIRAVFSRIALFLFAHAIAVMSIRIFTKKSNPASQEDPTIIKLLNRIITNTIEQTIIFGGLYVYFLFDISGDRFTSTQLISFASWFLLARILFSFGYLMGTVIGFSTLRGIGFALTVAINLLLIQINFSPQPILVPYILTQ